MTVLLALVSAPLAFAPAQAADTAVSGRVTDPMGTPVRSVEVGVWVRDAEDETYYPDEDLSAYTNRSGRFTLDLEPGTYKLRFEDYGVLQAEYYNDKPTLRSATAIVVESSSIVLDDVVLEPLPAIKGTVKASNGAVPLHGYVVAYGYEPGYGWSEESGASVDDDGTYALPVEPGTYRVGFFDGNESYVPEYWNDKTTVEAAADIVVAGPAGVSGIDAQLALAPVPTFGEVTNIVRPRYDGFAAVGETFSVDDGVWNPADRVAFTRQWLRDGRPIPGAVNNRYTVTPADVGARLTFQITGHSDWLRSTTVRSETSDPVKWKSNVTVTAKTGKKKTRLKIRVSSRGPVPSGVVQIKQRRKKIATVTLKNGVATVTVKNPSKKQPRFAVVYQGDGKTWMNRKDVRVRFKK